jgi:hypothetical protein
VYERDDDRARAIPAVNRRKLLGLGIATAATLMMPSSVPAMATKVKTRARSRAVAAARAPRDVRPELFDAALGALHRHGSAIARHDRIAIADFSVPSAKPRFHFVNLADGSTTTLLVAHGSGSDPEHTGWLKRFSNAFDSNASSQGTFATGDYYVGKHGRSQRLIGLDRTNSNALDRAIVIHGAWYANAEMISSHGKLGRSQGCFAVGEKDLGRVFAHLGTGRMIYAAKV